VTTAKKRKQPRAKLALVARYRSPTAFEYVEEQCFDLSSGGMFISSPSPAPAGTLLKLECVADDEITISGVARVVWLREKPDDDQPAGMGVKFVKLDPKGRQAIETILARSEPEEGEGLVRRGSVAPRAITTVVGTAPAQPASPPKAEPAAPAEPKAAQPETPREGESEQRVASPPAAAETALTTALAPVEAAAEPQAPAEPVAAEPNAQAPAEPVAAGPKTQEPAAQQSPQRATHRTGAKRLRERLEHSRHPHGEDGAHGVEPAAETERSVQPSAAAVPGQTESATAVAAATAAAGVTVEPTKTPEAAAPTPEPAQPAQASPQPESAPVDSPAQQPQPAPPREDALAAGSPPWLWIAVGAIALGVVGLVLFGTGGEQSPQPAPEPLMVAPEPAPAPEPPPPPEPQAAPEAPFMLVIASQPGGAQVRIGDARYTAPASIELPRPEAALQVSVELEGHQARTLTIEPSAFESIDGVMRHTLEVALNPLPKTAPPAPAPPAAVPEAPTPAPRRERAPRARKAKPEATSSAPTPAPTQVTQADEPAPKADKKTPMEQARACLARGDNGCVVQALEGHTRSAAELEMLVETYRAMGNVTKAERAMRRYLEKYPDERRAGRYRQLVEHRDQSADGE